MKPRRRDRRYDQPHYPLDRVREAVSFDQISIEPKAASEAGALFACDPVEIDDDLKALIGSLKLEEFQFCQEKSGSWVDVYRVPCEGCDAWVKIKLEKDPGAPEEVIVISFHEWDDTRPI